MARRRKSGSGEAVDEAEDWLVTYADAITLLMAFFVMLVSFSRIDLPMFEEVQAGIAEKIGGVTDAQTPIFTLEAAMNEIFSEISPFPPDAIKVGFDDEGLVIDFAAGYFFNPGTAELAPGASDLLLAVRKQLEEAPYDVFKVDVEGHSSNRPPPGGSFFPSNWEMSASQAARVVRELISFGFNPEWLTATGYADTKPKLPNLDVARNPVPANQAQNERISLRLHP